MTNFKDTSAEQDSVIVKVVSNVLEKLIVGCKSTSSSQTLFVKFQSSYAPEVSIHSYLDRIRKYSRCSDSCFIMTLIYIDRLIESRQLVLTPLNVHRLLITCIMMTAKYNDDLFYNNAYYAKLGGLTLQELNLLETDLLKLLNFSLFIHMDAFYKYSKELRSYVNSLEAIPSPVSVTLSGGVATPFSAQNSPSLVGNQTRGSDRGLDRGLGGRSSVSAESLASLGSNGMRVARADSSGSLQNLSFNSNFASGASLSAFFNGYASQPQSSNNLYQMSFGGADEDYGRVPSPNNPHDKAVSVNMSREYYFTERLGVNGQGREGEVFSGEYSVGDGSFLVSEASRYGSTSPTLGSFSEDYFTGGNGGGWTSVMAQAQQMQQAMRAQQLLQQQQRGWHQQAQHQQQNELSIDTSVLNLSGGSLSYSHHSSHGTPVLHHQLLASGYHRAHSQSFPGSGGYYGSNSQISTPTHMFLHQQAQLQQLQNSYLVHQDSILHQQECGLPQHGPYAVSGSSPPHQQPVQWIPRSYSHEEYEHDSRIGGFCTSQSATTTVSTNSYGLGDVFDSRENMGVGSYNLALSRNNSVDEPDDLDSPYAYLSGANVEYGGASLAAPYAQQQEFSRQQYELQQQRQQMEMPNVIDIHGAYHRAAQYSGGGAAGTIGAAAHGGRNFLYAPQQQQQPSNIAAHHQQYAVQYGAQMQMQQSQSQLQMQYAQQTLQHQQQVQAQQYNDQQYSNYHNNQQQQQQQPMYFRETAVGY